MFRCRLSETQRAQEYPFRFGKPKRSATKEDRRLLPRDDCTSWLPQVPDLSIVLMGAAKRSMHRRGCFDRVARATMASLDGILYRLFCFENIVVTLRPDRRLALAPCDITSLREFPDDGLYRHAGMKGHIAPFGQKVRFSCQIARRIYPLLPRTYRDALPSGTCSSRTESISR